MSTVAIVFSTTVIFAVIGALVTDALHGGGGFWARRIGRTPFRYANIPMGGALALTAALFLDDVAMWCALGAAWGMTATAVGWAWVDPTGEGD